MTHDPYRDLIDDYLDEALSADSRDEITEHLTGCERCRIEVDEYRRLRRLALASPPVPIPDDLGFRIRQRLEESSRARREARRRWYRSPAVWVATAAAVLLLLLLLQPPSPPARRCEPPGLRVVLGDWLLQAENAGPGDLALLAEEAREIGLLARVREALPSARGTELRHLRGAEDVLLQMLNEPCAEQLPAEAGLVAAAMRR